MFLADVLSACYGKDAIDKIVFPEQPDDLRGGGGPPRIDPKFVNNPELRFLKIIFKSFIDIEDYC